MARKEPKRIEQLGRVRIDDYAWMKDEKWQQVLRDPKVLRADVRQHLEAENAYTKAMLASTEPLQAELFADRAGVESSEVVAKRVLAARERAAARFAGSPWRTNSEVPGRELRDRWAPARSAMVAAERALDAGRLSPRGLDRVLRVAWTLADLAGRPCPGAGEIDEALYLRTGVAA